jgi:fumarate reductase subunit D
VPAIVITLAGITKEGEMDSHFWLGVIFGLPFAYGVAILANMHTPRLVHYLQSRKLLKTVKTREQAIEGFNRIKAFRDGTRDRYPYYILLASSAVVCAIITSTLLLLLLIIVFRNELPLVILSQNEISLAIPTFFLVMFAAIPALVMVLFLLGIYATARQIERFEDYKAEFEKLGAY